MHPVTTAVEETVNRAAEPAIHYGAVDGRRSGVAGKNELSAQQEVQRKRLEKEREQLVKNIANSIRQLGDETFLSKAPAKVIETIRQKLADYETQLRKIDEAL